MTRELGPGAVVKALSLWEPWATLMAIGAKTIETRSWRTDYRGPLLICGAKRFRREELLDLLEEEVFRIALAGIWKGTGGQGLAFGKAVCLVNLIDCRRTDFLVTTSGAQRELAFGDYYPGRFGWVTTELRRLVPFPVTGRQGLFDVVLPENLTDWRVSA